MNKAAQAMIEALVAAGFVISFFIFSLNIIFKVFQGFKADQILDQKLICEMSTYEGPFGETPCR